MDCWDSLFPAFGEGWFIGEWGLLLGGLVLAESCERAADKNRSSPRASGGRASCLLGCGGFLCGAGAFRGAAGGCGGDGIAPQEAVSAAGSRTAGILIPSFLGRAAIIGVVGLLAGGFVIRSLGRELRIRTAAVREPPVEEATGDRRYLSPSAPSYFPVCSGRGAGTGLAPRGSVLLRSRWRRP